MSTFRQRKYLGKRKSTSIFKPQIANCASSVFTRLTSEPSQVRQLSAPWLHERKEPSFVEPEGSEYPCHMLTRNLLSCTRPFCGIVNAKPLSQSALLSSSMMKPMFGYPSHKWRHYGRPGRMIKFLVTCVFARRKDETQHSAQSSRFPRAMPGHVGAAITLRKKKKTTPRDKFNLEEEESPC